MKRDGRRSSSVFSTVYRAAFLPVAPFFLACVPDLRNKHVCVQGGATCRVIIRDLRAIISGVEFNDVAPTEEFRHVSSSRPPHVS